MFRKHTNLVGQRICAERKRSGLSQEALAAQLYVTRQTISNWEVGKTMPDLESLKLLALALSVPIERLIYGEPLGFPVPWYQRIPSGNSGAVGWVLLCGLLGCSPAFGPAAGPFRLRMAASAGVSSGRALFPSGIRL